MIIRKNAEIGHNLQLSSIVDSLVCIAEIASQEYKARLSVLVWVVQMLNK